MPDTDALAVEGPNLTTGNWPAAHKATIHIAMHLEIAQWKRGPWSMPACQSALERDPLFASIRGSDSLLVLGAIW